MKIIGSDFDGTITTNKVILPETRKQIKQFRDAGNIFIIVTEKVLRNSKMVLRNMILISLIMSFVLMELLH